NCALSNDESNSGAVKSPASWCWDLSPKQKLTGKPALPEPASIPRRVHDQLAGFQIDQAECDPGTRAPALQRQASTKWNRPISGMLPDSPRRRPGRLSRESGPQRFPLFRVRRRRNRVGLRRRDGGLLFIRGSAKAAVCVLNDSVDVDTK